MTVKMATRVIDLIELFAREQQPLALSEAARLLDMPVSTCLGLLRTLEKQGYLYETGRRQGYYPTGRLLAMAQLIATHDPVIDRVRPALEELRDATQETVVFGKFREAGRVVYLEVLNSPQSIRYAAEAGESREARTNSLGRALLSTLSAGERQAVLQATTLRPLTEATLTRAEDIEAELHRATERGWFANMGESIADLGGIAWPVRIGGQAWGISVVGPRYRVEPQQEALAAMLRSACRAIEGPERAVLALVPKAA